MKVRNALFAVASVLVLGMWGGASVAAQAPSPERKAEMKKLDFMVGKWEGEGWVEYVPGQKRPSRVTESIVSKLNGLIYVIDGLGKAKNAETGEERVVHQAYAVISYDEAGKKYRFSAYLADGRATDAEAKFLPDGALQWGFNAPNASIRYTIRLTDAGEWHEIGEMSMDGKAWRKFFEMKLQRVKE